MSEPLANYIAVQRRRAGLSRRQLGKILGYEDMTAVSKHEKGATLPPLVIALAYYIVFRIPLDELFEGLHSAIEHVIEARLIDFGKELQSRSRRTAADEQTIRWLSERCRLKAHPAN